MKSALIPYRDRCTCWYICVFSKPSLCIYNSKLSVYLCFYIFSTLKKIICKQSHLRTNISFSKYAIVHGTIDRFHFFSDIVLDGFYFLCYYKTMLCVYAFRIRIIGSKEEEYV